MTVTTARPAATGVPGYSETFPREAVSARRARLLVAAVLHTWGVAGLVEHGCLIVSELVANAAEHGRGHSIRVTVRRPAAYLVYIGVSDKNRTEPIPRIPRADEENGWGLGIVEAVASDWGCDMRRWGKVVWAKLELTP